MIDEAFLAGWCERLRREIAGVVAVHLKGSHARGEAGPHSDLDIDVIVDGAEIAHPYLTWIEPDSTGRLVQISMAIESREAWLADIDEPASWSFGLASREAIRPLWVAEGFLELDVDERRHPAGDPELEDTVEGLGKARNAFLRGDELTMRLALRDLAGLIPSLLLAINPPVCPGTRPEALRATLAFPVAPKGYREDMLVCLGLSRASSGIDEVLASGERLVRGVLDVLIEHQGITAPLQPPTLDRLLADGTLWRYVDQDGE